MIQCEPDRTETPSQPVSLENDRGVLGKRALWFQMGFSILTVFSLFLPLLHDSDFCRCLSQSVCSALTNNFPCDICNLLETFLEALQCPPQPPRRLAVPSHLWQIRAFLKSYHHIWHSSPCNSRSQRMTIMTQHYTSLSFCSLSSTRHITWSKEYLFICPRLQMETEGAPLMESQGVKSSLFSVIHSNGMLVSFK